jgi:hypothetical protein
MMQLATLTPIDYKALRRFLRRFIEDAVHYSDLSLTVIEAGIEAGWRLPVVITDDNQIVGLMVCELEDDSLHITTMGGDLPTGWQDELWPLLTSMSLLLQRDKIQLQGRRGWDRMLAPYGFKRDGKLLRAEI